MRSVGMSVGSIERQDLRLVKPKDSDYLNAAGQRVYDDEQALRNAQARTAKKIQGKDIENMDNRFLQKEDGSGEDTELAGILAANVSPNALKALADKGGTNQIAIQNALQSFSKQVSHAADDIEGVTYALEHLGNRSLANYLRSTAGMRAYGFKPYPAGSAGGGATTPGGTYIPPTGFGGGPKTPGTSGGATTP